MVNINESDPHLCHMTEKFKQPTTAAIKFMDPLEHFRVKDGLEINIFKAVNTKEDLRRSQDGNFHIIQTYITMSQTEKREPVTETSSGTPVPLSDWLDTVLQTDKGIQIHFLTAEAITPAIQIINERRMQLQRPVFLGGNVMSKDGQNEINVKRFIELASLIPDVTLSFGFDTNDEPCGIGTLQTLWNLVEKLMQPINIRVPVHILKKSWARVKWLTEKSERITVTIFEKENSVQESSYEYDLLLVRNDFSRRRLYFDLPESRLQKLRKLAVTAGRAIDFFDLQDASKIIWSHATNTKEKLRDALQGHTMMIEADILLQAQGTMNQTNVPVMSHPPSVYSDLTFEEWIDTILPIKNKGVKLDFKSLEAVEPTLSILNRRRLLVNCPVWINADILQGPNGPPVIMKADVFLQYCLKLFPEATLSLGWTTGAKKENETPVYTREQMTEIHQICKNLNQPVTFPVRAAFVRDSWEHLDWLLQQSRGYTLTVWTSGLDTVKKADMDFIYRQTENHRIYFDLPNELMPDSIF
ncbi:hypothetical protein CHS0354_012339 [Potamilus streckersoni]|uniref:Menorin-like domain-containing protein n=1 Tax=Potamilus streckersoni TaxID=2493646 RepID=A0AAE0VX15_9BIVA|nr:hypothetical protein CHS0354_012339 [Potamilus streckersoni]